MLSVAKRNRNEVAPTPRSLFDEVVGDLFSTSPFQSFSIMDRTNWDTGVNVREVDNAIEVEFTIPGYKKEQLNVEYNDGTVTLRADKGNVGETKSAYVSREVDFEKATAVYDAGILTVTLPVVPEAVTRRTIPIS